MKAIITGITGFAGSFLAEHLVEQGHAVYGLVRSESNTAHLEKILDKITIQTVNLSNEDEVTSVVKEINPSAIFHLAAYTSPAESFKKPLEVFTNNISLEITILEALKQLKSDAKLLVTSSAEVYGVVSPEDLPLTEESPLKPGSPYAVSKIAQDFLAFQYFLSHKLHTLRVRPFNHIGPRQSIHFVAAAFASQIAEIEKGTKDPVIKVGNLDARRDFTDVRDMVKAYALIMDKGEIGGLYNVGSGFSVKISEILDILLSFSKTSITIEKDSERLRPSDTPDITADPSKIKKLGWEPQVKLEKTLKDTLDYWRDIV